MENVYQKLTKTIDESKIKCKEHMKNHISFKVDAIADYFITATTIEEIKNVLKIAKEENIQFYVLGNGSNVLFKNDFKGIVLQIKLEKIQVNENKLQIEAGVKNALVAKVAFDNSLTGFEFAAGIPGTIGGAIRMNAGAYGQEMKDIVREVTYLDFETLTIKTIDTNECQFSYRNSIFAGNKNIILSTVLLLKKGKQPEIEKKMKELLEARKEKQPLNYPSAGSTFKRGDDFITAKVIDECGLKGYRIGGAEVSKKHAGFIINKKNATAEDILQLINYVQTTVYEKTGKKIELEIEIV